jgi:hypothetical protein
MTPSLSRARTQTHLLRAAQIGAAWARADLAGAPDEAAVHMTSWRRLRRYADRDTRAMLRVAFDTGYGRQMTKQATPV